MRASPAVQSSLRSGKSVEWCCTRNFLVVASVLAGFGIYMPASRTTFNPAKIARRIDAEPDTGGVRCVCGRRVAAVTPFLRIRSGISPRRPHRRPPLGFLVDTGASVIALTKRSAAGRHSPLAQRLQCAGLDCEWYRQGRAMRASPPSTSAGSRYAMSSRGHARRTSWAKTCSGMSFLSRLRRFESSGGNWCWSNRLFLAAGVADLLSSDADEAAITELRSICRIPA